jgi:hypothetical protein
MRRNSESLAVVEVVAPTLGVNNRVPTNLPDKQAKRALQKGENVRCMDGSLQNAPGLGVAPMSPQLVGTPINIHNGNITTEDGFSVSQVPVIGTTQRIYSVTKDLGSQPPIVFAGEDGLIYNANIYFLSDASVTDPGGLPYTLQWTIVGQPAGAKLWWNPSIIDPIITVDQDGVYTLRLTATNSQGKSAWDEVALFFKAESPIIYAPHIPIVNDFTQPECDGVVQVTIEPEAYAEFQPSQLVRYLGSAYRVVSKDDDEAYLVTLLRECDEDPDVDDNIIPGVGPGPAAAPPGTTIGGGGPGTGYDDAPINMEPSGGTKIVNVNFPTSGANYGNRGKRKPPADKSVQTGPPSYTDVKKALELVTSELYTIRNTTIDISATNTNNNNWLSSLLAKTNDINTVAFGVVLRANGTATYSWGYVGMNGGTWEASEGGLTVILTTSAGGGWDSNMGTYVFDYVEGSYPAVVCTQVIAEDGQGSLFSEGDEWNLSGLSGAPYWRTPHTVILNTDPTAWEPTFMQSAGTIWVNVGSLNVNITPYKTSLFLVNVSGSGPGAIGPVNMSFFNSGSNSLTSGTYTTTNPNVGLAGAFVFQEVVTPDGGDVGTIDIEVRTGFNSGYFTGGIKTQLQGRQGGWPLTGSGNKIYALIEPVNNPATPEEDRKPVVQPGQVIKVRKATSNTTEALTLVPITVSRSPLQYTAKSMLPAGLFLQSGSGYLWGWCTANAGTYEFTMSATNEYGEGEDEVVSIVVQDEIPEVSAVTETYPEGVSIAPLQIAATNDPTLFKVVSGTVPLGITVDRTGIISGTPISAGVYTFEVIARNAAGDSNPATITLTVTP